MAGFTVYTKGYIMVRNAKQDFSDKPYVRVPPNATRTLMALREMGYDSYSAVCDLVDNSIDAGAKQVTITIRPMGKTLAIDIADNGRGMTDATLKEALRLGSDLDHKATDLGKFGMGLVTASLSLGRTIHVVTREKDGAGYEATLDLDTIERERDFVIELKPATSRHVLDTVGKGGTMVRLTNIDRIHDTNVSRFAATLRAKVGQTFRHYIAKGVNVMVNGRNARRHDPLMLDHPETATKLDTEFDLGDGTKATLKIVELPDLGTEGDAAANIFPHNSGFYVVRNGREIIAGETFGFYKHHHSYSHFRAELAYSGKTTAFHEDIKKSNIFPDDRLRERLRKATEKYIMESGRERREKTPPPVKLSHAATATLLANLTTKQPGKATQSDLGRLPVQFDVVKPPKKNDPALYYIQHKDGTMTIAFNEEHPLVQFVSESRNPKATALLDLMAYGLECVDGGTRIARDLGKELGKVFAQ